MTVQIRKYAYERKKESELLGLCAIFVITCSSPIHLSNILYISYEIFKLRNI